MLSVSLCVCRSYELLLRKGTLLLQIHVSLSAPRMNPCVDTCLSNDFRCPYIHLHRNIAWGVDSLPVLFWPSVSQSNAQTHNMKKATQSEVLATATSATDKSSSQCPQGTHYDHHCLIGSGILLTPHIVDHFPFRLLSQWLQRLQLLNQVFCTMHTAHHSTHCDHHCLTRQEHDAASRS